MLHKSLKKQTQVINNSTENTNTMKTATNSLRYTFRALLISTCALLMISCGESTNPDNPLEDTPKANVRLYNLVYDGTPLENVVAGITTSTNIAYGTSSGYKQAKSGEQTVGVRLSGATAFLASDTRTLAQNGNYTVFAFPPSATTSAVIKYDDNTVSSSKTKIRIVNAVTDIPVLHLRRFEPLQTLVGNVSFTDVSDYVEIDPGMLEITLAHTRDTVDFNPVNLEAGVAYTLAYMGTYDPSDSYPLVARLMKDDKTGSVYTDLSIAPREGSLLFVHAIDGIPSADIQVGTQTIATNLMYGSATSYSIYPEGITSASVISGGTAVINKYEVNALFRQPQTVFASGSISPADIAPLVLKDAHKPVSTGCLVRFVNLSIDQNVIDVVTTGPAPDYKIPGMQKIGYRGTSKSSSTGSMFVVMPPGIYPLRFRLADTDSVLLLKPSVSFEAGKIVTMWIGGRKSNNTLEAYYIKHN